MLDGDGQHPPELIADMVAQYRSGLRGRAHTARRHGPVAFQAVDVDSLYRILSVIGDTPVTAGSADFRLVARPVLDGVARDA